MTRKAQIRCPPREQPFRCVLILLQVFAVYGAFTNQVSSSPTDLYLLQTRTSQGKARQLCRGLGYDGLAVLRTREQYEAALRFTESFRALKQPVNIGGRFCESQKKFYWDDGIEASDEAPWGRSPPAKLAQRPFARLGVQGVLWMQAESDTAASLCGRYSIQPVHGKTISGHLPEVAHTNLTSVTSVNYYLGCVYLCGRDDLCVAAEFNSDLLTCTTFRSGAYTKIIKSNSSMTFIRN